MAALPAWREVVSRVEATLPAHERERYRRLAERAPDGDRVTHGDFHPGNVLRSERGLVIVDGPNACRAHPASDVARSFVLMAYQGLPGGGGATVAARAELASLYLDESLAAGAVTRDEVAAALPLAAAGVLRAQPANPRAAELARLANGDTDLVVA